jgi:hypothetical protein
MAHKVLVLAVSPLLLLLACRPAEACDCRQPKPLSNSVRTESPFIFEGRVVEIVERSLHTSRTTSAGSSGEVEARGRDLAIGYRSKLWR